jgi:hypothetical protein
VTIAFGFAVMRTLAADHDGPRAKGQQRVNCLFDG